MSAIYAVYLYERGKHEAALTEYRLAEAMTPGYAELADIIELLRLVLGNLDKARE